MNSDITKRDHLLRSADTLDYLAKKTYDKSVAQAENILSGSLKEAEQLRVQARELCDQPSTIPISRNKGICVICEKNILLS